MTNTYRGKYSIRMQTFLTIASTDYAATARTLDNKRLNKQALEAWQILMNLTKLDPAGDYREPRGWSNHPAVKMWRGSEGKLLEYILAMVKEWQDRGYNSTIGDKAIATYERAVQLGLVGQEADELPKWQSNQDKFEAITKTHRQALLVKDYEWYSQFVWEEDLGYKQDSYEYVWA